MDFANFDLNLLRVLDALLSDGSTVKAGERLGLTQPAISAALSRLRIALNDELFIRQGARLVPTHRAARLADPLRAELERMESMLRLPQEIDPLQLSMVFRVAGPAIFGELTMPYLINIMSGRAPGVQFQYMEYGNSDPSDALDLMKADIVLHAEVSIPPWANTMPMFFSSYVPIARRGQKALAEAGIMPGDVIPLDLYCRLSHVNYSPTGVLKSIDDIVLSRMGLSKNIAVTMSSHTAICRCVEMTDLLGLVPRQLAAYVREEYGLETYRAPIDIPAPLVVMSWHRRHEADPAHGWLRNQIASMLRPFNEGEAPLPE